MISLYGDNPDAFGKPKPYDPAESASWLEKLGAYGKGAFEVADEYGRKRLGLDPLPGRASQDVAAIFDAAERQQRLAKSVNSAAQARNEVFDDIIARVKSVTGVSLDNPEFLTFARPTGFNAQTRAALEEGQSVDERRAAARAEFFERAKELRNQFPDLAGLDLDTPLDQQARQRAFAAEATALKQGARDDINPFSQLMAELGGGIYGARKDPAFWLAFAAPGSQAATAPARIIMNGVIQGGTMAALTAAEQPAIQAWRSEVGLKAGFGEAVAETLLAAVFGAVPGMGISAAIELAPRMGRILKGRGGDADFKAAREAGLFIDDETRAAAKTAAEAQAAHDEILKAPAGVSRESAGEKFSEGLAHAADPDAPIPLGDIRVPRGTTDKEARAALQGIEDRWQGLDALRADDKLIRSALASEDPDLRLMGRLATLGDEALDSVRAGLVEPAHAGAVAGMTGDPARQSALMQVLREGRPADERGARELLSDAVNAMNAKASMVARMGGDARPAPKLTRGPERELSVFEELAYAGGLKPTADLQSILDGNPFVPGFGRLIRQDGLDLDSALRVLKDRGYLFDPADLHGTPATLDPNHVLDLIAKEARGQRQWRLGAEPHVSQREQRAQRAEDRKADRAFNAELKAIETQITKAVKFSEAHPVDREILRDAARLMRESEGLDPHAAWDQAALDYERWLLRQSDQIPEVQNARLDESGPIPGWDIPADSAPTSRERHPFADAGAGEPGQAQAHAGSGEPPRAAGGPDGQAPVRLDAKDPRNHVPNPEGGAPLLRDDLGAAGFHDGKIADILKICQL